MLSVTTVSLKILTGTFCYSWSCEKVLIKARAKELNASQKALIVKLWKDGESYRNISSDLNIPFTTKGSFLQGVEDVTQLKTKKNRCSSEDFSEFIKKIRTPA